MLRALCPTGGEPCLVRTCLAVGYGAFFWSMSSRSETSPRTRNAAIVTPSPFYFRGSANVADTPLTIFVSLISPGMLLKDFLDHLEHERHCKIRTRNQRLAAIHAMARFVAEHSPEDVAWCATIRAVPFKRFHRPQLTYLEKPEMDALLAAPDRNTGLGRRDYTLLLFLYNSGARISEASNLPINKLYLKPNAMSHVEIFGKGGKTRRCPLWATTAGELLALTRNRSSDEPVFVNRHGQAITRHGVHRLIGKYVRKAMDSCPSLANKCISPHTLRNASAYCTTFQSCSF